jgi:hypothetical protein
MALKSELENVTETIRFLPRGSDQMLEGNLTTSHSESKGHLTLVEQISGTSYVPSEVVGVAASNPEQEARLREAGFAVLDPKQWKEMCNREHAH